MRARLRGWRAAATVALIAAGLALAASLALPPVAMSERWLADFRLATLAPPEPPPDEVAVIAVDEDTLRRFPYRSPIDRAFLAGLVTALEAKGVRAIGIDLLFDQPTEPDKDRALAAALAAARVPLAVAYAEEAEGLTAGQVAWLRDFVPARLRAFANLAKDPLDGTVRWIFPGRDDGEGRPLPGFAPALSGRPAALDTAAAGTAIRWRAPSAGLAYGVTVLPAHLVPALPAAWLRGKVALIGTDISLADRHRTPFTVAPAAAPPLMPGVVAHAQALATLLDARPPRELPPWAGAVLTLAAALAAAAAFRQPWPLAARLGAGLGVVALGWTAAFALLRRGDVLVPVVAPTLAFALAAWAMEVIGHRDAHRHRKFLKQAFAQYVAPELVEQLVADPAMLTLNGEKREMTFLFTDVANFTTLAEGMDPAQLTRVLNDYLDGVCSAVFAHGGAIIDFIGDAVFALFGAPLPHADHRERAVACAAAVAAFGREYQARLRAEGVAFSHTRIGLHTGTATIGNIGSRRRFKYAPIGDAVNVASRLEGLNKHFGTRVCLSETVLTPALAPLCRPVGRIVLKGKSAALAVFELPPKADAEAIEEWRRAYALLEADNPAAESALAALAAARPEDGLAAFHLARARSGQRVPHIVMAEK